MSPFLAALGEQPRDCPPVAVGCGRSSGSPKRARSLRPALLDSVSARNASFNVSGIRDYRQCPYLYFSANTLDLRGRPPEPAERLDGRVVGKIVHSTIDRWNRGLGPIGGLLDKAFESALRELHLEADFRTERIRLAVRKDLERFAGRPVAAMAVPSNSVARFEEQVELRVGDAQPQPRVQCRIDRYDVNPGRDCVVTDYKYARSGSVKRLLSQNLAGEELQLALYLAALEQSRGVEPAGMLLVGLRDGTSVAGASVGGSGDLKPLRRQDLRRLLVDATQGAGETVGDVLRGRIEALPRDVGFCDRWCRFKPVCRVAWKGGTAPPDDEPGVR